MQILHEHNYDGELGEVAVSKMEGEPENTMQDENKDALMQDG